MTAGVYRQCEVMREYLIPALGRLNQIQSGWKLLEQELVNPFGCKFLWYSTDNPGFFEGQHADDLALLLDEGKSIKDEIARTAILRLAPKRTLAMSSTGAALGWFYDTFNKDNAIWNSKPVTAYECRPAVKAWAESEARIRGGHDRAMNDPDYASAVMSQFSDAGVQGVLRLADWNNCERVRLSIDHRHGNAKIGGLDVSAATGEGDECVLFHRLGNKFAPPKTFIGFTSYVDLAGSILEYCLAENLAYLNVDRGGPGDAVIHLLERMVDKQQGRLKVIGYSFGGKPNNGDLYQNKAAEMAFAFADAVRRCDIILPEKGGEKLKAQACTREFKRMPDNAKALIPKSQMRKNGFASPDHFDAAILCWQKPPEEAKERKVWSLEGIINSEKEFKNSPTEPGCDPATGAFLGL